MKRGNKNSNAGVEARRQRVAEALAEGPKKTRGQIAAEVGTNLAAVKRDLAALALQFQAGNKEAFAEYRKTQLAVFELMEESLVTGQADPELVREWRAVRSEISKLLGLNAENRSIVAHVTSDSSPLVMRFRKATAGLTDYQMEEAFQYLSRIPREKVARVIDASMLPAPEPKLLEESDDIA